MKKYQHTQIGYLTIFSLGGAMILIAFLLAFYEFNWIAFVVLIALAISLLLFASLTVEADEKNLQIRFGPGLIRKKFLLHEIQAYQAVKNHWYYGWGIRRIPHGWLYNVSGLDAIELQMSSGKNYRIGTDEPEQLVQAIRQILGR